MPFTDYGLLQLGSFVRGLAPTFPGSMAFGAGSNVFIGSQAHLQSEFNRRAVAWEWNGTDPRGTVEFTTTEFFGSNFRELGLANATAANGSTSVSRDVSAVGSKGANTALQFIFDFRVRRF